MDSVNKPKGLIRYASENNISRGEKLRVTPRMIGYSVILLVLAGGLITGLALRSSVDATVLRAPGMLFQELPNDSISNLYNFTIVNKSNAELKVRPQLEEYAGRVSLVGNLKEIKIPKEGMTRGSFFVILPKHALTERKSKMRIGFYKADKRLEISKTTFLGPVVRK